MSASKISHTDFGGPSALLPHCCRIAIFFVSSFDATLSLLSCNMRAADFVSNNTDKKNIVSDKYHKLCFIFFMSDIRNADTFDRVFRRPAELAFRRNGAHVLPTVINM
jgi:hypothetical protein